MDITIYPITGADRAACWNLALAYGLPLPSAPSQLGELVIPSARVLPALYWLESRIVDGAGGPSPEVRVAYARLHDWILAPLRDRLAHSERRVYAEHARLAAPDLRKLA